MCLGSWPRELYRGCWPRSPAHLWHRLDAAAWPRPHPPLLSVSRCAPAPPSCPRGSLIRLRSSETSRSRSRIDLYSSLRRDRRAESRLQRWLCSRTISKFVPVGQTFRRRLLADRTLGLRQCFKGLQWSFVSSLHLTLRLPYESSHELYPQSSQHTFHAQLSFNGYPSSGERCQLFVDHITRMSLVLRTMGIDYRFFP